MKKIELEALLRKDLAKKVRSRGYIPAIVYAKNLPTLSIEVNEKSLIKIFKGEAGRNAIISLKIKDDKFTGEMPVITHDLQKDFIHDRILHIDFYKLDMTAKIKTKVRVEVMGTPLGVKEEGGVLVHNIHEIEVKCLPGNIPDKFEVKVSGLKINDNILVGDLLVPEGVEILQSPEEVVASVSPPTKEEVTPPPVEAEVPAEGAAAAGEAAAETKAAEAKPTKEEAKEKPAKKEK